MKKKPTHKLYDDSYTLFVEQGMTCVAISEILPISEKTLSKWRALMEWDKCREEALSRPDKIKEILMKELQSVAAGNKATIDTDALSKIAKAIQYFDDELALCTIISVFMEFDNYMVSIDPRKAKEINDYHNRYISHLTRESQ